MSLRRPEVPTSRPSAGRSIGGLWRGLVLIVVVFGTGCGASGAPTARPKGEGAGGGVASVASTPPHEHVEHPGPPRPWAEMDWDARRRYMAREVLPVMAREFELYDPRRHADFDCESCHGADAESRRYAMPSPSLRPLFPTGSPQQQAMVREHPRMVRFMYNHVVPNMQRLLGAAPYDPETGQGFSCFACHPRGSS